MDVASVCWRTDAEEEGGPALPAAAAGLALAPVVVAVPVLVPGKHLLSVCVSVLLMYVSVGLAAVAIQEVTRTGQVGLNHVAIQKVNRRLILKRIPDLSKLPFLFGYD